tara:strand:+ start:24 stop:380 length:357 start_codon:yes stop_codon:yes gene_type:complete
MGDTIYTGVFFSDGTHMTMSFRPSDAVIDATPIGKTVCVRHTGDMANDDFYGISVTPMFDTTGITNRKPHITFGTFGTFKAGDISDRMDDPSIITPIDGGIIYGRIGRFTTKGQVIFN